VGGVVAGMAQTILSVVCHEKKQRTHNKLRNKNCQII